ncbi:hypothetical protein [Vogesella indigofera]|uniref:hypothetical protein n=1 Tax=Vogesella indigofera TaxID=45465 RepID=UPI00234CC1F6|nr:hypothetical protein [Vogesella indigofera]MDC7705577.1 hypothetical protein [Vogesella indigofera]
MSSRSLKTPPKIDKTASEPEAIPLPSPEDESHLAGRCTPQAEQLIALLDNGVPIYLFSRISSGHTFQSDFFRIQFVTFARAEGSQWLPLRGEASEWMNTRNCLQVAVDHPSHTVSFGPKSGFSLSPEISGLGLSGYAYSQAISWLKQRYPDYRVLPSVLPAPEADGEEARAHRNSRLAAHGFDFEWDDGSQVHGRYHKARVRQLISGWDNEKVAEVSLNALLTTLSRHDEERAELQHKLHSLQSQERSLETSLHKEKQTNLLLTGITCFVLIFSLLGALGFY